LHTNPLGVCDVKSVESMTVASQSYHLHLNYYIKQVVPFFLQHADVLIVSERCDHLHNCLN